MKGCLYSAGGGGSARKTAVGSRFTQEGLHHNDEKNMQCYLTLLALSRRRLSRRFEVHPQLLHRLFCNFLSSQRRLNDERKHNRMV